jgi:hypothetical protein
MSSARSAASVSYSLRQALVLQVEAARSRWVPTTRRSGRRHAGRISRPCTSKGAPPRVSTMMSKGFDFSRKPAIALLKRCGRAWRQPAAEGEESAAFVGRAAFRRQAIRSVPAFLFAAPRDDALVAQVQQRLRPLQRCIERPRPGCAAPHCSVAMRGPLPDQPDGRKHRGADNAGERPRTGSLRKGPTRLAPTTWASARRPASAPPAAIRRKTGEDRGETPGSLRRKRSPRLEPRRSRISPRIARAAGYGPSRCKRVFARHVLFLSAA